MGHSNQRNVCFGIHLLSVKPQEHCSRRGAIETVVMEHEVESHESPIRIVAVLVLEEQAECDDEKEDEQSVFQVTAPAARKHPLKPYKRGIGAKMNSEELCHVNEPSGSS